MAHILSLNLLIAVIAIIIYGSQQQSTPQPPYCHTCELIINDVKAFFNNNFANVTYDQLKQQLDIECDKCSPSFILACATEFVSLSGRVVSLRVNVRRQERSTATVRLRPTTGRQSIRHLAHRGRGLFDLSCSLVSHLCQRQRFITGDL
uniref:Saposin B-type domain-containing protein n=1 Tax=Plectus sambesii TaxID=2011161 RepID=A0A914XRN0_9BILA